MAAEHPSVQLFRLVLTDRELTVAAWEAIAAGGGDAAACLNARRLLEDRVQGAAPSGRDYQLSAAMLDGTGRSTHALLLSRIAATESRLAAAAARWEHRYDSVADRDSRRIMEQVSSGLLDLRPGLRGSDGVLYRPGGYSRRSQLHGTTAVLVQARGGCELLTGWESPLTAWAWVRSRLPFADGPLDMREGGPSRTTREEQLLAWGLRYPWELDRLAGAMSWHAFSCDARDEIFAAAVFLH